MVVMKDEVSSKLRDVFQSLEAAKKYGVDVREEEKNYTQCSIDFSKNSYKGAGSYSLVTDELQKSEQDRNNSILRDLVLIENTILDKRKVYQVREMLSSRFKDVKEGKSIQEIEEFISCVRNQLDIYNSCKILEKYSPELVINEIFSYVYEAIKMEIKNFGESKLLDEVMSSIPNATRVSSFLGKDVQLLTKFLGADNETVEAIRNYRSLQNSNNSILDHQIVSMVVDTISSSDVCEIIDKNTLDIQSSLNSKVEEASDKRKKYIDLAKLQIKARKLTTSLRRKIDKRIAPIVLSFVIMSGVGLGTYSVTSNVVNAEPVVTLETEQSNVRTLSTKVKMEESKSFAPLAVAGVCALASSFVPKFGFVPQGILFYKDKKKFDQVISEMIDRKHEMDDVKESLENLMNENSLVINQVNKQRSYMLWSSIYSGLSDYQTGIISSMNESLEFNSKLLDYLDETAMEEEAVNDEGSSRMLGR